MEGLDAKATNNKGTVQLDLQRNWKTCVDFYQVFRKIFIIITEGKRVQISKLFFRI